MLANRIRLFSYRRHASRASHRLLRPQVERLESRLALATLFGATTAGSLVGFDSASPGTISSSAPITGLGAGESVLGIDFRPASGQLFALAGTSRLYTIAYTTRGAPAAAAAAGPL